jgi:hypothetical protein
MSSDFDSSLSTAGSPPSAVAGLPPGAAQAFDQAHDSRQFRLWLVAAVMGGVVVLLGIALALALLVTKGPFAKNNPGAPNVPGDRHGEPSDTTHASSLELEDLDTPETSGPDRESQQVCPEHEVEVWLLASSAALRGGVQPWSRGGEDLLVGWRTRNAKAEWRFQVDYRGVYRVEITYARTADAGAGTFVIDVDGEPHQLSIGTVGDPGTLKKDEFFALLPKGQHALVCRALTPTKQGLLQLQSIRLRRLSIL